jgi:hypothetical protein
MNVKRYQLGVGDLADSLQHSPRSHFTDYRVNECYRDFAPTDSRFRFADDPDRIKGHAEASESCAAMLAKQCISVVRLQLARGASPLGLA